MPRQPRLQTSIFGRDALLDELTTCLAEEGPRVVFLHGIGGIGKTSVLRALQARTECPVHWIDALKISDPAGVADLAHEEVVILDGLDQAPRLVEALRRQLLPMLTASARIVLSSRSAPGVRWTSDLGHGDFRVFEVEGLTRRAATALLESRSVPPDRVETLVELCAGHPLMLVLAAQLELHQGIELSHLDPAPELLVAMVEALGAAPDSTLREATLATAIARRTTEPVLRAALGRDDVRDVFDSMCGQTWAARDRDGLFPHDLVRNAQRAEAKWRDRETYDRLFGQVAAEALQRLRERGAEALPDAMFLLADNPMYRRISAHGQGVDPGPVEQTADLRLIDPFFTPHFGPDHAERVRRLVKEEQARLWLLRGPDGEPSELMTTLETSLLRHPDPIGDPAIDCARRLFTKLEFRGDSQVLFGFGASHILHGQSDPLANARILATAVRMAIELPRLAALGSVVCPADFWMPLLERNPGITLFEEVQDEGMALVVQLQDMRVVDVAGWLEMQLFPPPVDPAKTVEILDRDEFGHAVREVLKSLSDGDDEAIATTRFARTPLVLRAVRTDRRVPAAAIRDVVASALNEVADPRSRAAVAKTYLEDAPKQYAVAVGMGLSFATYRRALAQGVSALTDHLWQCEVIEPT